MGTGTAKYEVDTINSGKLGVMTAEEVDWYESTRDAYLTQTRFDVASDQADLDRLLLLELMIYRWSQHLASGADYEGDAADAKVLQANIKTYTEQVTKLKSSMGLTREARDKAANDGSVAQQWQNLLTRAKAFGIHREKQVTKAIALLQEAFALAGAYRRSDVEERRKLGLEDPETIIDWLLEVAQVEFNELDADFRKKQTLWVQSL